MSMRHVILIGVIFAMFSLAINSASGQSSTSKSKITVFNWQNPGYRNFDVTTRGTEERRSVTVFDWQNPGFKNYDITTRGTGNRKSVTVFDWQNPGYKNYDVTTRGTGDRKSVTVFDWQNPGYKYYDVTTHGSGNTSINVFDWNSSDSDDEEDSGCGVLNGSYDIRRGAGGTSLNFRNRNSSDSEEEDDPSYKRQVPTYQGYDMTTRREDDFSHSKYDLNSSDLEDENESDDFRESRSLNRQSDDSHRSG